MIQRGNVSPQTERFEQLHMGEPERALYEREEVDEMLEEVDEMLEEVDDDWFEHCEIEDPTDEQIEAMIEVLEGENSEPSGAIDVDDVQAPVGSSNHPVFVRGGNGSSSAGDNSRQTSFLMRRFTEIK